MAQVDYNPATKHISYYRGNTFKLTDSFFESVDGLEVPLDLELPGIVEYEAHIKYSAMQATPDVVISKEYFQLGSATFDVPDGSGGTQQVEIKNILNVEAPPSLFVNLLPVECAVMDIFQYFFSGGVRKYRCLRRYELDLTTNVTQTDFSA